MTRPYVIGVTGNIACGKSAVMHELGRLGATVIDGDLVYRDLTGPGSSLVKQLVVAFGADVANPDGSLNRPVLGKIVFSDPAQLLRLDHLSHPAVIEEVEQRIDLATTPVVATDGIKLLESGMAERCDEVWVVTCEPERQIERLMARNGYSVEEARRRIEAQGSQEAKIARADVVIANDGTLEDLREKVRAAWSQALLRRTDRGYLSDGYDS